jgi:aconitate hydratase
VVAYAIAGWITKDLTTEPLGEDQFGKPVFLKEIWPTELEIQETMQRAVSAEMFKRSYSDVFTGDERWRKLPVPEGNRYAWDESSTYIRKPTFLEGMTMTPAPPVELSGVRVLALLGDSITTDHISPAGSIKPDSPAGKYLIERGVKPADFNSYGARRGNHEVMMRGTFANIRIKNFMLKGADGNIPEGGLTKHWPDGEQMTIYDAAMKYQAESVPLVVFAGAEYGNGSSRDWAAKGTRLLGVRAVICQSFERIHRSNLVGMGVLPLTFEDNASWQSIGLKGDETVTIRGLQGDLKPRQTLTAEIVSSDGTLRRVPLLCRIDTLDELEYYRNGGILHYVLRKLAA